MKKIMLMIFLLAATLSAQTDKPAFGITFSGFVKTDLLVDSRQTEALREGHFLLYPANIKADSLGVDINDGLQMNLLSIQTRLAGKISGPDAFGAKTSGLIEGEFFGTSDADINGFRLRHAYARLDWSHSSLLIGQTWHPMFVLEMFPAVVSFNTGAPFQPFSRNPQIRWTHNMGGLKLIAVAAGQRDFTSNGPAGFSSTYLRNALLPNLHGQFQYVSGGHLLGAGVDYKRIRPRLVTARNFQTDETIAALSYIGYARLQVQPVTLKFEGVYGGNLADHLMLGGYAVASMEAATGHETYTTLNCLSVWGELTAGKTVEYGLFGGYSKNLGAAEEISGTSYGRGLNIATLYRLSPRVQINSGKNQISAEVEYTHADYGKANMGNKGQVEEVKGVANLRLLLAFTYLF